MGLLDESDVNKRKDEGPHWVAGLSAAVGRGRVTTAAEVLRDFGTDRWHAAAMPDAVVEATCRDEVVATMRYASEHGIPVTTRGSGVGYVGGCVPVRGGILLSVRKMDRILEINAADGIAVVEPGVILDDLQESVRALRRRHDFGRPERPRERRRLPQGRAAP